MARKEARATPAMLSSQWPNEPSTEPVGEAARRFALSLKSAIGERSVREVARTAGIDEGTIRNILLGESWPDLRTIWKLESSLETSSTSADLCREAVRRIGDGALQRLGLWRCAARQ